MRRTALGFGLAVLAAAVSLLGCGPGKDGGTAKSEDGTVLALVAASTKDAVHEAAAAFTRETGTAVKLNADDSSKLATQIVNGAPADLFLSANTQWAEFVRDKGFVHESRPLLGNRLVLVVPVGNPAHVGGPQDLAAPAVHKVAVAGPNVPAGIYARQALTHLHLWDELERHKKIVSGENVRVALSYVERGEAEAGVVYATDAKITERVESVYPFAPSTHEPIVYPLVLLQTGARNEAARKFYDYLQSPKGTAVFQKYGFTRPDAE
jgi:molybdate transport system substrate-binding protein